VDQISLPYRVALVALLVVGGLWFAVLKPKPESEPASTKAPGVTGLAKDVDKAKSAVNASNASAAATEAAANAAGGEGTSPAPATGGTATQSATTAKPAAPAKPGLADDAVEGDPSKAVLSAVDHGKVAVVLFWNDKASDDRATRRALRDVDTHHGKVVTRAVPIGDVGKYEAITRGAQVLESPTVLVIGAGGKARAITGYTQAKEIDELVSSALGK
jgi:cytoskeletal protein RodZ